MFINYLKIALRNSWKNKAFSMINIGGLALGMCVAILIGLWVVEEFTFDKYHENYDRIAQIYERSESQSTGELQTSDAMMYVTGTVLKENYSDYFTHILRSFWTLDYTLKFEDQVYTQKGIFIEDGILDMLSLRMIRGSHASLQDINAIVLSESASKAIFGSTDPIGQPLKLNNDLNVVVKGVYQDLPKNTSFGNVKFFANWELFEAADSGLAQSKNLWDNYAYNLFVELKPESNFESVDKALGSFFEDYAPKEFARLEKYHPKLFMHPMAKWHFYSDFEQGYATGGRITYVWLFIGIGIFVLLLACINFMNLSTARSEKRAKEIGVRKVVGSFRRQLIKQFLSESLLVSFMSLILAFGLALLAMPWFNQIAGIAVVIPWASPFFWLALVSFTVITGMLAGSYPALYLSSFKPIQALKGNFKAGKSVVTPRRILVVFQFMVSILLTISTVIVFEQIKFTQNRPIGYDYNNLISLDMNNPEYHGKYNLLRSELKSTGVVEDMSQSSSPLTNLDTGWGGFDWQGKDPDRDTSFGIVQVTHDYGKVVGWQFVDGRDFSREFKSDSSAIVINETAVKYMGLENPVGSYVSRLGKKMKIIGVIKDMIMDSPYEPVKQTVFFLDYKNPHYLHIRIKRDVGVSEAISKIETVLANVVPSAAFNYKFIDQEYGQKFEAEKRLGSLAGVFTFLAIIISSMGLFSLASYIAEQRTKEIGVRKVLGASVLSLWKMLCMDFVGLVLISCSIAVPVAYHFMSIWLQNYEYRMEIPWWIFCFAVIGALVITLITVSSQAIRAANINPVKSLRTE